MHIELEKILQLVVNHKASDLHISNEPSVYIRKNTLLSKIDTNLSSNLKNTILKSIITTEHLSKLDSNIEIDFSFKFKQHSYFRAHYYKSMGGLSASFRHIPIQIPTLEKLNLSSIYQELTFNKHGLVLITGSTGSGKSTTIASMLNHINNTQSKHIVTLEDPIEFQHKNNKSIFSQRTIGEDTYSFKDGIKSALRQNPDVIFVGEIRDMETMQAVLTASQTGHLVFATLHTSSTVDSIQRVLNLFNNSQRQHVQSILSTSLLAVISQTLLPTKKNNLHLISEVMIPNSAIKNLIKEGKVEQIYSHMKLGQSNTQMTTQTNEINKLLNDGTITTEVALNYVNSPSDLNNN